MLIQSIDVTTDAKTENSLIATIHCREVIIVQTSSVALAPTENQGLPQKTAPIVNTGVKQPQATATRMAYRVVTTVTGQAQ